MKRSGVSLDAVADWHTLSAAFHRAALGKGQRQKVIQFGKDLPPRLASLRQDILAGTVTLGQMRCFHIRDPKPRIIHAPCFRGGNNCAGIHLMQTWPCCKVCPVGGGRTLARAVCFAGGPGTTTRGTAVLRTVTRTTSTTATTTLAFVAPELTTKPDGLNLNRPPSTASAMRCQNPKAPGVLVAEGGCPANARRRANPF